MSKFPDPLSQSARLFQRAQKVLPGGNSRQTVLFAPYPIYGISGRGCRVKDVDGVERIDFVNNYSSLIHGHGHEPTTRSVASQLRRLTAVGLPTEVEIDLAEFLCSRYPAAEQIRFLNSGSEAIMLAVKTARALTGRSRIAKIEGAYHGLYDFAEISLAPRPDEWGNAAEPNSVAHSPGTPASITQEVVVLPFNDAETTRRLLSKHAADLAAILLDVLPAHLLYEKASPEFLSAIQEFQCPSGPLLILDEVYSLRLHVNGAHTAYGLRPDLIAMGKIIGGGFPVGALGGPKSFMSVFNPEHPGKVMPHGGTYNANPITMSAGLAAMRAYDEPAVERLNELGERARRGMREAIRIAGVAAHVAGEGSLLSIRFSARKLRNYRDIALNTQGDARTQSLFVKLLNDGILSNHRGLFVLSTAMGETEIDRLLEASLKAFRAIAHEH